MPITAHNAHDSVAEFVTSQGASCGAIIAHPSTYRPRQLIACRETLCRDLYRIIGRTLRTARAALTGRLSSSPCLLEALRDGSGNLHARVLRASESDLRLLLREHPDVEVALRNGARN